MTVVGFRLENLPLALPYLRRVQRRLNNDDWRVNGLVKGRVSWHARKGVVVLVVAPGWPRVYLGGPLLVMIGLLFWGGWWLGGLGVVLTGTGVLWSGWWWSFQFRRGLWKEVPRMPVERLEAERALMEVLG